LPFEERNIAAFLSSGLPICDVGDPNRLEAILVVEEGDVEFLRPGQSLHIFLDQLPGDSFGSRIEQISRVDLKVTPRNLSHKNGGELASRIDSLGRERPLQTTYQANALLDDEHGLMLVGATGKAKIKSQPQTIARRLWRYLCQTFTLNG
jgi:putative peptide zinc metalloprotease protein